MMRTNAVSEAVGRDTTMCGDPKTWFPMKANVQVLEARIFKIDRRNIS